MILAMAWALGNATSLENAWTNYAPVGLLKSLPVLTTERCQADLSFVKGGLKAEGAA